MSITTNSEAAIKEAIRSHEWQFGNIGGKLSLIRNILQATSLAERKRARDAALDGLLTALEALRRQRAVAIAIQAGDEHLAELDAEEESYHARARELGAAWARPAALDLRGWPDHLPTT